MKDKIILFDVDGTLCKSGKKILNSFIKMHVKIGLVGESVYHKYDFEINKYDLLNKNNLKNEAEYLFQNVII